MIKPTAGFIVFGVHKDGLKDPMGTPFIDQSLIDRSKAALQSRGVELICHDTIIASLKRVTPCS